MKRFSTVALQAAAFALAAGGMTTGALAQDQRSVPKKWDYEIKDGKRVPKPSKRVTNSDGSWREEIRKGNCVTIKEKTPSGEYKESRSCD